MRGCRNFRQGDQVSLTKKALNSKKSIIFFKVSEGGPTFSRGGGGGSNCLFLIESHITCDFPWGGGGSGPPAPPLPSGSALVANLCAGSNSLTVKIFNTFDWIKIMCTSFFLFFFFRIELLCQFMRIKCFTHMLLYLK